MKLLEKEPDFIADKKIFQALQVSKSCISSKISLRIEHDGKHLDGYKKCV